MHRRRSTLCLTFSLGLIASGSVLWACSSEDEGGDANGSSHQDSVSEAGAEEASSQAAQSGIDGAVVDGGVEGATSLTPEEVCRAYVKATCLRRQQCGIRDSSGTCDAVARYCPDYLFAPGTTQTVNQAAACTQVLAQQPCAEVARRVDPPCVTVGARQADEACQFNSQCASMRCGFSGAGQCSRCLPIHSLDAGCPGYAETCGQNMTCPSQAVGCAPIVVPPTLATGATCVADGGVDASACPVESPCAATTAGATSGVCSSLPTTGPCLFVPGALTAALCGADTYCLRTDPSLPAGECVPPGTKDDLCGMGYGGRPCTTGLFCTDRFKGTCQPQHKLNETCQSGAQCTPPLFCDRKSGAAFGSCVARATTGSACGVQNGDAGGIGIVIPCEDGAQCERVAIDGGEAISVCVKRAALGGGCSPPYGLCANPLECKGGVCSLAECIVDAGGGG